METMSTNDPFYMSAPASPRRIRPERLCFLTVPTSPARRTLNAAYDLGSEPTPPKTTEDSSSNVDEFEFQTSSRFDVDEYELESGHKSESQSEDPHQNHVRKESLPAMAFADELFSDGKVKPLKPPPRLQYPNDKKFDKQSSTLSSPRSPTGVLRLPFHRRSLWNDDFDPFMAALENVKEEKVGKSLTKNHRRARSMSPFRDISPKRTNDSSGSSRRQINQMGLILPTQQSVPNLNKSIVSNESTFLMWVPDQDKQMGRQEQQVKKVKKSSIKLAEPKGVLFARRTRLVKVGQQKPRKPSLITPAVEAGESAKETGVTCTKETKSQKIKNFIFRSRSMRKISNEEKPESSNATESGPNLTRKFSSKSLRISKYKEKSVSGVSRVTLVQHRPKLLLCMGYGAKYVQ